MTKPTEKVYLKKFYIAIGIVVRDRKVYVKNLDLGEWAPLCPPDSSATPPAGLSCLMGYVCLRGCCRCEWFSFVFVQIGMILI